MPMDLMRKLGWAALLATSGAAPSAVQGLAAAPAATPAASAAARAPAAPVAQPLSCWFGDDDDLLDDEFEGEGWTFWGL